MNDELIPNWLPERFIDSIDSRKCTSYKEMMLELSAADLRIMIMAMGTSLVLGIRKRSIPLGLEEKSIFDRLILYYADPLKYETKIMKLIPHLKQYYQIKI